MDERPPLGIPPATNLLDAGHGSPALEATGNVHTRQTAPKNLLGAWGICFESA